MLHCRSNTLNYKNDRKIGFWVSNKRAKKKKNMLSLERVEKLDAIGFVWSPRSLRSEETFDAMYKRLAAYKKEHGNCNVPR